MCKVIAVSILFNMDRLSKPHFGLLTCFLVSAVFILVTQECKKTTAMIETAEESGNELRVSKKQEGNNVNLMYERCAIRYAIGKLKSV